jgi:NAD(P)-dependent dehydrogenase (short-subunit alcohol dehydrogenase family)
MLDRDEDAGRKKATEIAKFGVQVEFYKLDVTKKSDFISALDFGIKKFGKIDALINGAGINAPTPILEINEIEWDSIMAVHLKGTLFGCQVFGEHMLSRKSGSILNISSASAGPPLSKAFTYSVAKAGIKNLTQNIAREWATQGVRVNALRPGFFPTEWSRKNFITKDREAAILGHTAMKRYGEANELVGAVLWLFSDSATFVTGAEIAVDGGYSAMTI